MFCVSAVFNLGFGALHLLRVWAKNQPAGFEFFRDPRFSLEYDRGFAEWFEYGVTTLTVVALVLCALRFRIGAYWAFVAAHVWIGFDNALKFHEEIGLWVRSSSRSWPPVVRSDAGSEVVYFALVALIGAAAFWGVWRTTPGPHRPAFTLLALGLLSIGVFAVGVDVFHTGGLWGPLKETAVILVEDGGEALALSANLAIAMGILAAANRRPRPSLAVAP